MEMNAQHLQGHILGTYVKLRLCAGITALAFPLILWIGGAFSPSAAIELQPSISAYYHTPLRDFFVGVLFIVGVCLFAYQGYAPWENRVLDVAGVLAIGVALIPSELPCDPGDTVCLARAEQVVTVPGLHAAVAIAFFLCIGYVCVFESRRTLELIGDPVTRGRYRTIYRVLGAAMVLLPLLALFLSRVVEYGLEVTKQHWAYRTEFAAIWVFAAYWLVKSHELRKTQADLQAARGSLKLERAGGPESAAVIQRA